MEDLSNIFSSGMAFFVGAGISKLPPAHAPVWKEVLHDFVESLFLRMERERWPASNTFVQDKSLLQNFNFRPESFWEIIQQQTSFELVYQIFQVVNNGVPNLNHRLIAHLLSQGTVANVVTTNFDEYIDAEISPSVHRIITREEMKQAIDESKLRPLTNCYFKIHGTISEDESLKFTLTHTTKLPAEKIQCLKACLSGRPLLIAGYSGNDDDVMPHLQKIMQQLPAVMVVVHPGSRQDEPIRELTRFASNVTVLEADINVEFRKWVEREIAMGNVPGSLLDVQSTKVSDVRSLYEKAVGTLPIVLVPLVISILFEFTGNIDAAVRYAHLAEDVCEDSRYSKEVSKGLRNRVFKLLSIYYGTRDARFSAIFAEEGLEAGVAPQGSIAKTVEFHLQRVFSFLCKDRLSESEEKEAEFWITGAYTMSKFGIIHGDVRFHSCWFLGRLRSKQGRLAEAVAAYNEAGENSPSPESMDHVMRACFTLDYGTAVFKYSVENRNYKELNSAYQLFNMAESLARQAHDYSTVAKALMNIARVEYFRGEIEVARQKILDAEKYVALTGDDGLKARIAQLKKII